MPQKAHNKERRQKTFYICAAQAHYLVTSMVHTKGATVSELTERDYFPKGKRRCLQKAYFKVLPDPIVTSPIPRCVDGLSWQMLLLLLLLFTVHPPHFSNLLLLLLLLLFPPRLPLEQRHRWHGRGWWGSGHLTPTWQPCLSSIVWIWQPCRSRLFPDWI